MASRDVRVRVRPSVVRVRISETAIRAVVRITAEQPQLSYQFAYHRSEWLSFSFVSLIGRAKSARGIEPLTDLGVLSSKRGVQRNLVKLHVNSLS